MRKDSYREAFAIAFNKPNYRRIRHHPEITTHEKAIQRRQIAKDNIKKHAGMNWEKYNREVYMHKSSGMYDWIDIECRIIVILNTLLRER